MAPQPAPVIDAEIPADKLAQVRVLIDQNRNNKSALIAVLQKSQEICGFLPPSVQEIIAVGLNVSAAEVYGVVTFYSFFTMKPRGKNVIRVCMGTACFVCGGDKILYNLETHLKLKTGETSPDMKYTLEEVRCLGACGIAPVVLVNQDTHGSVDPNRAAKIVDQYQ